jgi:hypothetical protein
MVKTSYMVCVSREPDLSSNPNISGNCLISRNTTLVGKMQFLSGFDAGRVDGLSAVVEVSFHEET